MGRDEERATLKIEARVAKALLESSLEEMLQRRGFQIRPKSRLESPWSQAFVAFVAVLVGAAAGAYGSYLVEDRVRDEELHGRRVAAAYEAQQALDSMGYRIEEVGLMVSEALDKPNPDSLPDWVRMPVVGNKSPRPAPIAYADLTFLHADGSPLILASMKAAERSYGLYLDYVERRSEIWQEFVVPIVRIRGNITADNIREIERELGLQFEFLVQSTAHAKKAKEVRNSLTKAQFLLGMAMRKELQIELPDMQIVSDPLASQSGDRGSKLR